MNRTNEHGQPIGEPVPGWTPRPRPGRQPIEGRWCRIEPLDPARHAGALSRAFAADADGRIWTYMGYGPFATAEDYRRWAEAAAASEDPLFYAILDRRSGEACGIAAYLRIEPAVGVLEIGHIALAPALQRTAAATEAMYLLMRRAFDELGYRRYEWKCDALNAASRAAALRLGFDFEGIFRQATIYKGRNRDTAWYALIDQDWPARRAAFEAWLAPTNFAPDGSQLRPLAR
ncbi:MAG: GNAT family protein [Geminicoccaceae bacterium]